MGMSEDLAQQLDASAHIARRLDSLGLMAGFGACYIRDSDGWEPQYDNPPVIFHSITVMGNCIVSALLAEIGDAPTAERLAAVVVRALENDAVTAP